MGEYRDPQDIAAERLAQAERAQNERLTERRAEMADLDRRGRGLFKDARAIKADELTRADCAAAGIRNERDIQEAQARVRERDAALLAENPDLSPQEYLDILKAPARPLTPEALKAREDFVVATNAIKIYRPASAVRELIGEANAQLPAESPVLNQRLRERGGAVSPPVLRTLIDSAAQRKDATLRSATAGRSFFRNLPQPKPADPGPDWGALGKHPRS